MNHEDRVRFGIDPSGQHCEHPWQYSSAMLQRVSRTFALNIKVLPRVRLRQPVLLAYLFCRMADTVEDCAALSAARKMELLSLFAAIFDATPASWGLAANRFVEALPQSWRESEDDEEYLCSHCHWCIELFHGMPDAVRQPIARCVIEMCEGMADFALRQDHKDGKWLTIENEEDLDRYCYFVAGVVGNMLSDLFYAQSRFIGPEQHARLRSLSVSFGLALQLVNITKDMVEDSQRAVCFVPLAWLKQNDFSSPESFFAEGADPIARGRVSKAMIRKAWRHLRDAHDYVLSLPLMEPRIRLFCQWPMLMAAETLLAVGNGAPLFSGVPVKIGRAAVARIVRRSSLWVFSNTWFKRRFAFLARHGARHTQEG